MSWKTEPAQLGITFGAGTRRRAAARSSDDEHAKLLILHGPTLLDAAGEVELWARFTGRDNGGNDDAR